MLGHLLNKGFTIINYIYSEVIKSIPNVKDLLLNGTNKMFITLALVVIVIFSVNLLLRLLKGLFYLAVIVFCIFLLFKFIGMI